MTGHRFFFGDSGSSFTSSIISKTVEGNEILSWSGLPPKSIRRLMRPDDMLESFSELAVKRADAACTSE